MSGYTKSNIYSSIEMDFDKLKSQQKIQSGSKPRRIVLHPAGSQKRSRYGRRVITSNGRVTARSQLYSLTSDRLNI